MDLRETQPPRVSRPHGTDAPAPAQRSRAKRKPKLTNEGRPPSENRKRAKEHSTIATPRKIPGKSAAKPACFEGHPTFEPIYTTTARMQMVPIELRKCQAEASLKQEAPAATSAKLLFPPPHLWPPDATEDISKSLLQPARRSSHERRHGGPKFTIYEDGAETHPLFLFGADNPFYQWHRAPITALSETDNPESDQENNHTTSQRPSTINGQTARLTVMLIADTTVVQRRSIKANPQVPKQAIDVLRMMR